MSPKTNAYSKAAIKAQMISSKLHADDVRFRNSVVLVRSSGSATFLRNAFLLEMHIYVKEDDVDRLHVAVFAVDEPLQIFAADDLHYYAELQPVRPRSVLVK